MDFLSTIFNSQYVGVLVGALIGWYISYHFHKKGKQDSDCFIETLRSDNNAFKQQLNAMMSKLPDESEKKVEDIRRTIMELDAPVKTKPIWFWSFGIALIPWILLWILVPIIDPKYSGTIITTSIVPGFIFLALLTEFVFNFRSSKINKSRYKVIQEKLDKVKLTLVEKDYLKRWVSENIFLYFSPTPLHRIIEKN